MDQPLPADVDLGGGRRLDQGQTLLDICQNADFITPEVWLRYYEAVGEHNPKYQGLLPFRVWQLYRQMVASLQGNDPVGFLGAAGVLAHYVGNACQPLHVSRLHHGLNPKDKRQAAVHDKYEAGLIDARIGDILGGIDAQLQPVPAAQVVVGGKNAAIEVIGLMTDTIQRLPPREIVDEFNRELQTNGAVDFDQLRAVVGERTVQAITQGSQTLAKLWQSAWVEGTAGGQAPAATQLKPGEIAARYQTDTFVPARYLREIADELH